MDTELRQLQPHRVAGEGGDGVNGVESVNGDAIFGCVKVGRTAVREVEDALADG